MGKFIARSASEVNPIPPPTAAPVELPAPPWAQVDPLQRVRAWLYRGLVLLAVALLGGRAGPDARDLQLMAIRSLVTGWEFSILAWEIRALGEHGRRLVAPPTPPTEPQAARALVRAYLDRARQLGEAEHALNVWLSEHPNDVESPEAVRLRARLAALRAEQARARPTVEVILADQVAAELRAAGFGVGGWVLPPVLFTFAEPPQKLTISPRSRIEALHSQLLDRELDPAQATVVERTILERTDLSAYIAGIGGLGTWPTMVIDRAPLPWVLSTVAHEWVHNYLLLFPLGLRYGRSPELTTLNETVAEIVGDEIGRRVLLRHYPELYPVEPAPISGEGQAADRPSDPPAFDFTQEMRETRLQVDRLLAAGLVETAEAYMEARRRRFVAHGYPLRVLNQAYFAFHGNYATGPASTSPIGPKLQELRERTGDLRTFLHTVRWFTDPTDLDRALQRYSPPPPTPLPTR